jgi:hypothetical protein
MKCVELVGRSLGNITLQQAFDVMFGEETMKEVHGSSLNVSKWNHKNERKLSFKIDIEQVPREIRTVFCGNKLKITTKQYKLEGPNRILVKNNIKMHFLGAEFFRVKPKFMLHQDEDFGQVYVSGRVEHHSLLPPPLNNIAEGFMAQNSKKEMDRYASIVEGRLLEITVNL